MDRLTKLALTGWTCAAILFEAWLLHDAWRELPFLTLSAIILFALAAWRDRRVIAVVLVVAYVYPALIWYLRGVESTDFNVLWIAALFGAILPDLLRTPWRLPRRWRGALMLSGLIIAVAVPIAVIREVDGHLNLFVGPRIAYWPDNYWFFARWATYLAVPLMVGLLFFESLFAGAVRIEPVIGPSLALGAMPMAAVAAYQRLVDKTFLNGTMFEVFGRATGTMYDSNVMGMIAAFSIAGVCLWAMDGERRRILAAVPAVLLLAVALWASASRTAFVSGAMILGGAGFAALLRSRRLTRRLVVVLALVLVAAVSSALALAAANPDSPNPVSRLWILVSRNPTPGALLGAIWRRDGYGTIATEMIRQWPVSGAGVGAFNTMSEEIGARLGTPVAPDNAQNWLRQQVAEVGFVGSLGWAILIALFAAFVLRPRRGEPDRIWIPRATLVAFGMISFVGMPSQNPMVAITFIVFAYWYCQLAGEAGSPLPTPRWTWPAIAIVVVAFTASTVATAQTSLRLPERARRKNVPFEYGFGPVMPGQAGYRSINTDAAILILPVTPWMSVSLRRDPASAGAAPVDVRVSVEGRVLMKVRLDGSVPFTSTVRVPVDRGPSLLEASVRTVPRSRIGLNPLTDVAMQWEFVNDAGFATHQYERP